METVKNFALETHYFPLQFLQLFQLYRNSSCQLSQEKVHYKQTAAKSYLNEIYLKSTCRGFSPLTSSRALHVIPRVIHSGQHASTVRAKGPPNFGNLVGGKKKKERHVTKPSLSRCGCLFPVERAQESSAPPRAPHRTNERRGGRSRRIRVFPSTHA